MKTVVIYFSDTDLGPKSTGLGSGLYQVTLSAATSLTAPMSGDADFNAQFNSGDSTALQPTLANVQVPGFGGVPFGSAQTTSGVVTVTDPQLYLSCNGPVTPWSGSWAVQLVLSYEEAY